MALVEFALILPVLVTVVFGTIDLGRAYELQNRLHGAAHEGAQFAQFFPCDLTGVVLHAQNEGGTASPDTSLLVINSVSPTCPSLPSPGSPVVVTVSRVFTPLTPLIGIFTVRASTRVVVQG